LETDRCGQRTCPLAACIRVGLIVGFDSTRTKDMRVAILDEVRAPTDFKQLHGVPCCGTVRRARAIAIALN
jgi:hypothetical protein